MKILLNFKDIPESGPVEVTFTRSFHISITAKAAQRLVNDWFVDEVSYMIAAGPPTLLIGEKVAWRVPAILTAPHIGEVGTVGVIDVNVYSGDSTMSPETKDTLLAESRHLAAKMPSYERRTEMPAKFSSSELTTVKVERIADPLTIIRQAN